MSTVLTRDELRALANLSRPEGTMIKDDGPTISRGQVYASRTEIQHSEFREYLKSVYKFRKDGDDLKVFTQGHYHAINATDLTEFLFVLERKYINVNRNDLQPILKKI